MYKFPASFDPSTYLTIRGARICYFEATNRVLKEKRQGTKVRVRRISEKTFALRVEVESAFRAYRPGGITAVSDSTHPLETCVFLVLLNTIVVKPNKAHRA